MRALRGHKLHQFYLYQISHLPVKKNLTFRGFLGFILENYFTALDTFSLGLGASKIGASTLFFGD